MVRAELQSVPMNINFINHVSCDDDDRVIHRLLVVC